MAVYEVFTSTIYVCILPDECHATLSNDIPHGQRVQISSFFMETHHAGEDVSYLYCIQNSVTSMGKIRENQLSDIFGQIGHMGPRTGYLIYCFRNLS